MKKTLSIISALVLLISSFAFGISAMANDSTSGYVGNSNKVKFSYNTDDKTLTISGKGKLSAQDELRMDPMDLGEFGPFYSYYSWYKEVEKVVIKEGVQDLPSMTFRGFESLKSAYIPVSVKEIGIAFEETRQLTDVYYSGTITQWNKINFKYQQRNEIIVIYYDNNSAVSQKRIFPATHFTGSKTGWITESKKTYYLTKEHTALYGLQKIGSKKYVFKKTTGELLKGKVSCDGAKYIMSKADGHMMLGRVKCDGKYYITNKKTGKIMYGLVQCDGKKYITDSKSGEMKYGKVKYKGKYYIASKKDGHLFINTKVKCDGKYYKTDKTGAVI